MAYTYAGHFANVNCEGVLTQFRGYKVTTKLRAIICESH